MNDKTPFPFPIRDSQLTDCILQLAQRSEELGEKETAVVLHSLAAHRLIGVDAVMCMTAGAQASMLKSALEKKLTGEENL